MRKYLSVVVILPILLFPLGQLWAADDLNGILEKIKTRERSLKTFIATFSQTKKTQLLKEPLLSVGMIYFDNRGRLLFQVTSPSPVTILFKGGELITWYPDLSKVKKRYVGAGAVKKYFGLGNTVEELKKQYHIELSPESKEEHYRLRLTPRTESMAKRIEIIGVEVGRDTWLPATIHFREQGGDFTTIKLDFISINEPLPPDIFKIDIPEKKGDAF